jgi:hypothetical protein
MNTREAQRPHLALRGLHLTTFNVHTKINLYIYIYIYIYIYKIQAKGPCMDPTISLKHRVIIDPRVIFKSVS